MSAGRLVDQNAVADMIAAEGGHDDGDELSAWADDGGYVGVPTPRIIRTDANSVPNWHGGYIFI